MITKYVGTLPGLNLRCAKMVQHGPGWPGRWPKVWAKMAAKMAQPQKNMGPPDLSVGGSRRFREVFSEGFWLKVIWF